MSGTRVFIIAEAGVNHDGDLATARRMVDAAKSAGADAVKFQTFTPDALVTPKAKKAAYQGRDTQSDNQLSMLSRLALPYDAFRELKQYCDECEIEFMSTPFDEDAVKLLKELNVKRIKIGSGDLTNHLLLSHVNSNKGDVILSTGMGTLDEIKSALTCLPDCAVSLLHCVSAYPAEPERMNLRAMDTLRDTFSLPVGLSDHSLGIHMAVAATAMGATIIEKHFSLDPSLPGPDHAASLNPDQLAAMIKGIRDVELALGSGIKSPDEAEKIMSTVARRSLVLRKDCLKGHRLTLADLTAKRPGTGIDPTQLNSILGKTLTRDLDADHIVETSDFE